MDNLARRQPRAKPRAIFRGGSGRISGLSGAHAERLAELSSIVERLVRVMQATYVPVWMRKPIPLLDDDKPLDVIAAGDYRRVSRVLAGLEASGAV